MTRCSGDYTTDELISVCIARQVEDGEVVAQGIATPLVLAGLVLARLTHAPNLVFASAIGQTLCYDWAPLSISQVEDMWLGRAVHFSSFARLSCEVLPTLSPKEFFRPAQIDAYGNFNNVVIGEYRSPRFRLPGCGGIADVTLFCPRVHIYVPRHDRRVFVERLDFRSAVGFLAGQSGEERRALGVTGPGPRYLVTDLGQFDFAGGRMRLTSYHPGVSMDTIRQRTGFELAIAPDVHETPPPTADELRLLREEIDPLGIRRLECLPSAERRAALREIVEREATSQKATRNELRNEEERV